jgi:lipopolysaccharide/colanic/teichoic acid biosynthesis glycosyltransferase
VRAAEPVGGTVREVTSFPHPSHLGLHEGRETLGYRIARRTMDIVVASLSLLLLSPLLLLIAVAIRLDSDGPSIFAQERVRGRRVRGGSGRDAVDDPGSWEVVPFVLYKFRTMEANADISLHRDYMTAYLQGDEGTLDALRPGRQEGESFRPAHDPRVTRVGAALRKMSLDELPQLWNVIKGQMSLVGPRPPLAYEIALYEERHLSRLTVRPGLTGLAQVHGRTSLGFEDQVDLDLAYLRRRSFWLDLKILLWTIPTVLSRKGAD